MLSPISSFTDALSGESQLRRAETKTWRWSETQIWRQEATAAIEHSLIPGLERLSLHASPSSAYKEIQTRRDFHTNSIHRRGSRAQVWNELMLYETCLSWVHRKKTHESRVPRLYRHTHMCSSFGVCVENVRAHLQMCRGTHPQACVCSRKSANSKANSGRHYHQWHQQSVTERRREDVHCLNTVWLNSSVQLQRIQHFNSGMTRSAGSADLFCIILRYLAQNYNLDILF